MMLVLKWDSLLSSLFNQWFFHDKTTQSHSIIEMVMTALWVVTYNDLLLSSFVYSFVNVATLNIDNHTHICECEYG